MGGKGGYQSPEKKVFETPHVKWQEQGGFRDTWVQAIARKSSNPGPGRYRTDMDLPMNKCKGNDYTWATDPVDSDTFAIQNSRRDRPFRIGFSKSKNETILKDVRLSPEKPSFMQVRQRDGTSSEVMATPGPGHYVQLTQFGAASGGHRHHYFPQTPKKGASAGASDSGTPQKTKVGVTSG
jgi:hypothetical protein